MEEKTYYDWLFEETEEEKEIQRKLDEERERYEATEAYQEHKKTLDGLFTDLKKAGEHRREEAKNHRPQRTKIKRSEEEMAEFREKNRKEKEARIEAYPEPLREIIRQYRGLDDAAKKVFQKETWEYTPDHDKYQNPKTSEKDMKELLEVLVQTTIDFVNERGLTDVYSVGFGVDNVQNSAAAGEWVCSTDADIHVTGLGKEKGSNGQEYTVEQNIGDYM